MIAPNTEIAPSKKPWNDSIALQIPKVVHQFEKKGEPLFLGIYRGIESEIRVRRWCRILSIHSKVIPKWVTLFLALQTRSVQLSMWRCVRGGSGPKSRNSNGVSVNGNFKPLEAAMCWQLQGKLNQKPGIRISVARLLDVATHRCEAPILGMSRCLPLAGRTGAGAKQHGTVRRFGVAPGLDHSP